MGYDQHALLAFGGFDNSYSPGFEIWQCHVRGLFDSEADYSDMQSICDIIAGRLRTWFGASANYMSSAATLNWVKLNEIGPDGRYVSDITNITEVTAQAGGQPPHTPSILTCAFSWTTGATRGLAHRGRIFPPVALDAVTTGTVGTKQSNYRTSALSLLTAIAPTGTLTHDGLPPYVVSPGGKHSSVGVARRITGVEIGDLVDVQRRRKSALPEAYVSASWP